MKTSRCDVAGMMISKGNHPQMAVFQLSGPFLRAGKGPAKEKTSGLISAIFSLVSFSEVLWFSQ